MIKGLIGTVVSASLAGVVGVGLFFIKHEVKEQEARLAELNAEIQRSQEAIHVLKAEWSYLNDPTRLRQLSEKFLGMKVMQSSQIATLTALPKDQQAAPVIARAEPVRHEIAKAEPARPQPTPVKLAAAPIAAKPAPLAPPPRAPLVVAQPVQSAQPPALAPSSAPLHAAAPSRSILIQSPALAQSQLRTQAPAGEVR